MTDITPDTPDTPNLNELEAVVLGILDGLATVLSPQIMQIITDRAAQHLQPDE